MPQFIPQLLFPLQVNHFGYFDITNMILVVYLVYRRARLIRIILCWLKCKVALQCDTRLSQPRSSYHRHSTVLTFLYLIQVTGMIGKLKCLSNLQKNNDKMITCFDIRNSGIKHYCSFGSKKGIIFPCKLKLFTPKGTIFSKYLPYIKLKQGIYYTINVPFEVEKTDYFEPSRGNYPVIY